MSKKKNKSKKYKDGRVIQTRDEYLSGNNNFRKKGYEQKGLYRKAVIIDSNSKDEVALVKLKGHSSKRMILDNYRNGVLGVKPFVETGNWANKPIKIDGKYYLLLPVTHSLSKVDLISVKIYCLKDQKYGEVNRKKLRALKGQKK